MSNFLSVGTDKVRISSSYRVGSTSLEDLQQTYSDTIKQYKDTIPNNDVIYIVIIRDILDKWKSGYVMEFYRNMERIINITKADDEIYRWFNSVMNNINNINWKKFVPWMEFMHDMELGNCNWMYQKHACFWNWNSPHKVKNYPPSLYELSNMINVYFLELKDLSNPKFIKWLQEKDKKWEDVKEIPYSNPTHKNFWPQMDLFWERYNRGDFRGNNDIGVNGKILFNPFSKISKFDKYKIFELLYDRLEDQQKIIDFIRTDTTKYISGELK